MKTAISIPDDLFADAERLAQALKKSRSRLYGDAVREYLARHSAERVTEALDRIWQTGEYLAYIFWEADGVSNATGFTVSEEPVPMKSIGVSRPLHLEDVRDLYESRLIDYLWAFLFHFLPVILLAAAAVVCAWKRGSGWPYVLGACLAVAVAAWQTWITVRSMGRWDPVFHGIKLSILAVVVLVDLAAAGTLLMARSRREAAGEARPGRLTWLHAGFLLLIVAAALYVASLLWLVTTGE